MLIGANHAAIILEVGVIQGKTTDVIIHAMRARVSEVNTMPRSVTDILAQADELAKRFENYKPNPADEVDPDAILALREAVAQRSAVEEQLVLAITQARQSGMSWKNIGSFIGTSGEPARQKYSPLVP